MSLRTGALLAALLVLAPAVSPAGDDGPGPGGEDGEKLRLIVDYLPSFMYAEEKLAFSFRVERRLGLEEKLPFRVSWHFEKSDGRAVSPGCEEHRAKDRFTILRGFLKVPRGARRFRYELSSGGRQLASGQASFLGETEKWPEGARAGWCGMVTAEGDPLVLTLEERVAVIDDRWKPLKWIWKKGRSGAESVVVAGPLLGATKEKGYPSMLSGAAQRVEFLELPPIPEVGGDLSHLAQGIYRLVELVETSVAEAAGRADLVVLLAPPDDPEMATEPRRYRQGMDWVLSRLGRAGAERIALLPPQTRRVPARQLAAYTDVCREAARVYEEIVGSKFIDATCLAEADRWTPPGATGRVTGRYPNEKGHRDLAELIKGACR